MHKAVQPGEEIRQLLAGTALFVTPGIFKEDSRRFIRIGKKTYGLAQEQTGYSSQISSELGAISQELLTRWQTGNFQ